MMYLYRRGKGARRRVMHLARFDPDTGVPVLAPICGRTRLQFNTTINMPLGQRVCRWCADIARGVPR